MNGPDYDPLAYDGRTPGPTAFLIGAFRRHPQETEQLAYGGAA